MFIVADLVSLNRNIIVTHWRTIFHQICGFFAGVAEKT